MTTGNALTALALGDLDSRHGHLEDFEPKPMCAGPLTELVTVRRTYVFNDDPGAELIWTSPLPPNRVASPSTRA